MARRQRAALRLPACLRRPLPRSCAAGRRCHRHDRSARGELRSPANLVDVEAQRPDMVGDHLGRLRKGRRREGPGRRWSRSAPKTDRARRRTRYCRRCGTGPAADSSPRSRRKRIGASSAYVAEWRRREASVAARKRRMRSVRQSCGFPVSGGKWSPRTPLNPDVATQPAALPSDRRRQRSRCAPAGSDHAGQLGDDSFVRHRRRCGRDGICVMPEISTSDIFFWIAILFLGLRRKSLSLAGSASFPNPSMLRRISSASGATGMKVNFGSL